MKYIEISGDELRDRFAEHLQAVSAGQHFIITMNGVRCARLTPTSPDTSLDGHDAIEELKRFRRADPVSHALIRSWIEEGRT